MSGFLPEVLGDFLFDISSDWASDFFYSNITKLMTRKFLSQQPLSSAAEMGGKKSHVTPNRDRSNFLNKVSAFVIVHDFRCIVRWGCHSSDLPSQSIQTIFSPWGIRWRDKKMCRLEVSITAKCLVRAGKLRTYGSFIRMNILAMKKLRRTLTKPMNSSRKRLSLGMFGALERSRMMKPRPPIVNRKLEASPSMMYWPFTLDKDRIWLETAKNWLLVRIILNDMSYRYARKATGRWCPCSSVIEPTLGGSTITS